MDAELTFSLNPEIKIFGSTSESPLDDSVLNVWVNNPDGKTRNVNLPDFDVQKSPYSSAKKILIQDIYFTVS